MSDRKKLRLKGLLDTVEQSIKKEKLAECKRSPISWKDIIMSGLAIFTAIPAGF